MAIQLMSNVKIITSGKKPTVENLLPGQAAFGKWTIANSGDDKYHLFGNTGEGGGSGKVVDIVLDTYSAISAATLQTVLTAGNTSTLDIEFKETAEGATVVKIGPSGIFDHGKVVLSANPDLVVSEADATTMRGFLSVYSKAEIDGKIAGAFHMKGSVDAAALPTEGMVAGDVYNIKSNTTNVKDIHNQVMKAGDNVVYVDANGDDPAGWDILSGVVDLSGYYTKDETDSAITTALEPYAKTADVNTKVEEAKTAAAEAKSAADAAQATANEAKTATETNAGNITKNTEDITALQNAGYQTADDVNDILTTGKYVKETDTVIVNAKKLVVDGDGTKVLKDDGTYDTLEISVVSI